MSLVQEGSFHPAIVVATLEGRFRNRPYSGLRRVSSADTWSDFVSWEEEAGPGSPFRVCGLQGTSPPPPGEPPLALSPLCGSSTAPLIQFIAGHALAASQQLAKERGRFPKWERSLYAQQGLYVRNATRTSIAPTGTLSIIADTSASIEPLFALAYRRQHVLGEQIITELNPLFLRYAREQGFYSARLVNDLQRTGSLADVPEVPQSAKALFRTALEIPAQDHLRVQATFQKYVDNAVSKTINLPQAATAEDIDVIYRQAWEWGLKGITIYRYGSKRQQVLELGAGESPEEHEHFASCDPYACRL